MGLLLLGPVLEVIGGFLFDILKVYIAYRFGRKLVLLHKG